MTLTFGQGHVYLNRQKETPYLSRNERFRVPVLCLCVVIEWLFMIARACGVVCAGQTGGWTGMARVSHASRSPGDA